jgi:hypothetical protein
VPAPDRYEGELHMRFKAVNLRLVLSSLLAVLALSAVAASAAQAATAEGPFYKISGTRLASGSSKEVKTKATGIQFYGATGPEVECREMKLASGAKLLGSTGANFGSGEATLEVSHCTVSRNGVNCEVANTTYKSMPLKLELAYHEANRTGGLLMLLSPVKGKAKSFIELTFTGSGCLSKELALTSTVGAYLEVGGKPVEAGKEPAAAKVAQLHFTNQNVEDAWLETGGSLAETENVELDSAFGEVLLSGTLELELPGGAEWGVFT